MKALTEMDLRAATKSGVMKRYAISKGTIVTPAARSFATEKGIQLVVEGAETEGGRLPRVTCGGSVKDGHEYVEVRIGVSNRHVHLSQDDLERLFGKGHSLTKKRDLGQPGQFAAEECVLIAGPRGALERVRVLGPVRKQSQVEVSIGDCFLLGIEPVVRESGELKDSPGGVIVGPEGAVVLAEGFIVAQRHVHMHASDAERLGLRDGQAISVEIGDGPRRLLFNDVVLRVREDFVLEFHVDIDEANAARVTNGDKARLVVSR